MNYRTPSGRRALAHAASVRARDNLAHVNASLRRSRTTWDGEPVDPWGRADWCDVARHAHQAAAYAQALAAYAEHAARGETASEPFELNFLLDELEARA